MRSPCVRYATDEADDGTPGAAPLAGAGGGDTLETPRVYPEPLFKEIRLLEGAGGRQGEEAGRALVAEMRCLRTLSAMAAAPAHAAVARLQQELARLQEESSLAECAGRDKQREVVVDALKLELGRLLSKERTASAASSALSGLQRNLGAMRADLDKCGADYLSHVLAY